MAILKTSIFGGSNIGVYMSINNKYLIYPPKTPKKIVDFVQKNFPDIITIETFIGNAAVAGSFIAMNSFGIILPNITREDELAILQKNMHKDFQITVIETKKNAFGNLVLCNDKGAIISPKIADAKEIIEKALKVPVKIEEFANSDLPGSCGLANNSGVLVHPMISEDDAQIIAEMLDVEIDVSTINCGDPFIGGGAVVNDFGGIFGRDSTGPEIQRIFEILDLR